MNQRNYQRELDWTIERIQKQGQAPRLLLHSCCAPCSSYVIEYLSEYFFVTVFYYNPNIYPKEEYEKRVNEQKKFIETFPTKYPVDFIQGDFEKERFFEAVKGFEDVKEGGERCFRCFKLRLNKTAELAQKLNADYFTTTLTISPLKNAQKLNEIGEELGREYDIPYLVSDFKKRDGYKRSIELCALYGLYRQDYCGCVFSKNEREERR